MKKFLCVLSLFSVLTVSAAQAMTPSVIGGIRNGLALGMTLEDSVSGKVDLRMALEASTGGQPLIFLFGGKFYLTNLRRIPLSLGLGFVGDFGNARTDAGVAVSLILDRIFDVAPLFFEGGIDVAGSGKIQAQLGYKL